MQGEFLNIFGKVIDRISEMIVTLPENEIFIGLVFAGLTSVIAYTGRGIPKIILRTLKNNLTTHLTFSNHSSDEVLEFVKTLPSLFGPKSFDIQLENDNLDFLRLGQGLHFKIYKKRIMYLSVNVKYTELDGRKYIELSVIILSREDRLSREFIEDVKKHRYKGDIQLKVSDSFFWRNYKSIYLRNPSSLFYNNNLKEEIRKDILTWKESEKEYRKLGIPFRRGYLFYGKPGTGKTSIVPLVANWAKSKIIYILDPSMIDNNSDLTFLFSVISSNSILLVEDIDVSFGFGKRGNTKKKTDQNTEKGITFSGLLNCLDGLFSCEDIIIIFTTNHKENIDPALIRPGRVDRIFKFEYLNFDTLKEMVKFYDLNISDNTLKSWGGISPAEAQNRLISIKFGNNYLNEQNIVDLNQNFLNNPN